MIASVPKRVEVFIPDDRMDEFKSRLARMRASAKKLDLPEWEVEFSEAQWRTIRHPEDGFAPNPRSVKVQGRAVVIVGTPAIVGGWRFLAKIEHAADGNLVKSLGEGAGFPQEWHSCAPGCAHCNVARQRNNTFMLQNHESGEIKQVGSTCVEDFLGEAARDPERIAAYYSMLLNIERDFEFDPERESTGMARVDFGVDPIDVMATALMVIEEDGGFISAEKAEAMHCMSTGQAVRAAIWSPKGNKARPSAAHVEKAGEIVGWLREQSGNDSLWLRNIAVLARRDAVSFDNAGLFASGFVAWNRHLQRQLKTERGEGELVGQVGEKLTIAATFERRGGYETSFGYKSVLTFRDEAGNALVWKTQSAPRGLVEGRDYHLTATVNGHGEYNGEKQTEIARAKIAELELFSFGALNTYKKFAEIATADVGDSSEITPLIKALWSDHIDHARVLLEAGANPNQLNQGEVPALASANSPEMVKLLVEYGARAENVPDEWLEGMEAAAREAVIAARPVFSLGRDDCVEAGMYSGMVLRVDDGIVTQRINREGQTVHHDAGRLSMPVNEGDVVDIRYVDRKGVVDGLQKGLALSR